MGLAINDWKLIAKIKLNSDYGLRNLDATYWLGRLVRVEFTSGAWLEGEVVKFNTSLNSERETVINFELKVVRADGDFSGSPNYLFRPDDVVKVTETTPS